MGNYQKMYKSRDKKVQKFLEDILCQNEEKFHILQKLRKIVFEHLPRVNEKIMYGGIMFSYKNEDIGGIFSYQNHTSFEFSKGFTFNDPNRILEGRGKFRRHIKIKTFDDIKDKEVDFFVQQMK